MQELDLVSRFSETKNSYKCMLFITSRIVVNRIEVFNELSVYGLSGSLPTRALRSSFLYLKRL